MHKSFKWVGELSCVKCRITAQGVYKPTDHDTPLGIDGVGQQATFRIPDGVKVYGGYEQSGTIRDPESL